MHKTQYLIFELGRECNLGHLHKRCPNKHPDRYAHVDTSTPMSDETIVDTAVALIQEHGFQGMIGFHYYNEPLFSAGRMFHVIDEIIAREPSAQFVLWTNGTMIPRDASRYVEFSAIHVTDYELESHPCLADRLASQNDTVQVHRWQLDERLNYTGGSSGRKESDKPCCRMFTEMIFDYYGNVHLCCYDWRGLTSLGNINDTPLAVLVIMWISYRKLMCRQKMSPMQLPHLPGTDSILDPPGVCRTCTAPGRTTHITNFVEAPATAARQYRRGLLEKDESPFVTIPGRDNEPMMTCKGPKHGEAAND